PPAPPALYTLSLHDALPISDAHRLRDLCAGRAFLYRRTEEDPGVRGVSVRRGELRGGRDHRASDVERAVRLAAARRPRADRRRYRADPSALTNEISPPPLNRRSCVSPR